MVVYFVTNDNNETKRRMARNDFMLDYAQREMLAFHSLRKVFTIYIDNVSIGY